MSRRRVAFSVILLLVPLVHFAEAFAAPTTTLIASGFTRPVYITAPPGDTARLFVVEQRGIIWIITTSNNQILGTAYLDISAKTTAGTDERGLLGLAFHPDYATNGFFFVYYTDLGSDTIVERYTVSGDANVADSGSGVTYYTLTQPFPNHNAGMIAFRPEDANNYLYIALGDGGSGNDPQGNGQNLTTALGSILRMDVDAGPFVAPATNPFFDGGGGNEDLIWVYGLRNPWRWSFDRRTKDMYIGDVGQSAREEIDFIPAASSGGENFGWQLLEGVVNAGCGTQQDCDDARANTTLPIHEYDNNTVGFAVVGGYVYRGKLAPMHTGKYFFADHGGDMWSFIHDGVSEAPATPPNFVDRTAALNPTEINVPSFGEGGDGELYFVNFSGQVHQIIDSVGIAMLSSVSVDFSYNGAQLGTVAKPYYTLENGVAGLTSGGTITIEAGTTTETMTLSTPMTILANGGTVRIGGL